MQLGFIVLECFHDLTALFITLLSSVCAMFLTQFPSHEKP